MSSLCIILLVLFNILLTNLKKPLVFTFDSPVRLTRKKGQGVSGNLSSLDGKKSCFHLSFPESLI